MSKSLLNLDENPENTIYIQAYLYNLVFANIKRLEYNFDLNLSFLK